MTTRSTSSANLRLLPFLLGMVPLALFYAGFEYWGKPLSVGVPLALASIAAEVCLIRKMYKHQMMAMKNSRHNWTSNIGSLADRIPQTILDAFEQEIAALLSPEVPIMLEDTADSLHLVQEDLETIYLEILERHETQYQIRYPHGAKTIETIGDLLLSVDISPRDDQLLRTTSCNTN